MKEQVIYGQSVLIIIILEMQQKFKASLAMLNTYKLVFAEDQTKLFNYASQWSDSKKHICKTLNT